MTDTPDTEEAYQGLLGHITAMEAQDRARAWAEFPPTPVGLLVQAVELLRAADAELEKQVDGGYVIGELRDRIGNFLDHIDI